MRNAVCAMWATVAAIGLATGAAMGQISDGSDGALTIVNNTTINLDAAATAAWNTPSPAAGGGVYDAEKWAVVYKYSSVTINAGRTLSFTNHRSRAPVVWLVSGNVNIMGTVSVNGADGARNVPFAPTEGGPGGFRGGARCGSASPPTNGCGFGPGGGVQLSNNCTNDASPGGHFSAGTAGNRSSDAYGSIRSIPLIGGSGGSKWYNGNPASGGGGGGAILIICDGTITVNGSILANGGSAFGDFGGHGGGGGTIRLVAPALSGTGSLQAVGQAGGGNGVITIETNNQGITGNISPSANLFVYPAAPQPWPAANAATVRILSIDGNPVGADPLARTAFPFWDVYTPRIGGGNQILIETRNLATSAGAVRLRLVPLSGADSTVDATLVSGNATLATWQAAVPLPPQMAVVQATGRTVIISPQLPNAFSREVAVWRRACPADLDDDGDFANGGLPDNAVTIEDLLYFLVGYEEGSVAVDLDDGSGTGVGDSAVTIEDLLYFLVRFEAGC